MMLLLFQCTKFLQFFYSTLAWSLVTWSSPPRMLQPCHQLPSCVGRVPGSQMEGPWGCPPTVSLIKTTYYTNLWGCKCLLSLEGINMIISTWNLRQDSWCSKLSQPQLNRVAACCSDQWYPKQIQILKTDKIQPLINLPGTPKNTCSSSWMPSRKHLV